MSCAEAVRLVASLAEALRALLRLLVPGGSMSLLRRPMAPEKSGAGARKSDLRTSPDESVGSKTAGAGRGSFEKRCRHLF